MKLLNKDSIMGTNLDDYVHIEVADIPLIHLDNKKIITQEGCWKARTLALDEISAGFFNATGDACLCLLFIFSLDKN